MNGQVALLFLLIIAISFAATCAVPVSKKDKNLSDCLKDCPKIGTDPVCVTDGKNDATMNTQTFWCHHNCGKVIGIVFPGECENSSSKENKLDGTSKSGKKL
ncbi:uncharacterized protein LOC117182040 [Belonocnema kinseyi]|uniref:uncharacterized protein LOC117182040 n=1 Tax=Belonocnema kinseyi TaxID=2817044 RepID=UPI00143D001D|nr:uncharacterized protein LOC117182040 [Belonocnema kinseyi]